VVRQFNSVVSVVDFRAFSFFSSQGGNWAPKYHSSRNRMDLLSYYGIYLGTEQGLSYIDGEVDGGLTLAGAFEGPPTPVEYADRPHNISKKSIANRVTVLEDKISRLRILSVAEYFLVYRGVNGSAPFLGLSQRPLAQHMVQLSQLYHSRHSYWMDSIYSSHINTNTRLNQFIFVQDAIPAFWSKKNPIDTKVWLRLRPFAASLDAATLIMKIRQESYLEDTGYIDISNVVIKEGFDAGGDLLGVEVTYFSPVYFNHNAIIYIYLSIRDVVGNLIKIEYWFTTVQDYLGPYLDNLSPGINQADVPINTSISFDILDGGTGVDIDTFEMNVNSLIVVPTIINKVTDKYYRVEYFPASSFMNGKEVVVSVHVADRAAIPNWLHYGYKFYTKEGSDVIIVDEFPSKCVRGISRFSDVSFIALDGGSGVDKEKLRLQIHDLDVTDHPYTTILPIIYRVL